MKQAARILIVTMIVGSVAAVPAMAQRGPARGTPPGLGAEGGARHGAHFPIHRLARFLDLSDEQIAQAEQLKEDAQVASQPLTEQGRTLRETLGELLQQENPSAVEVGETVIALRDIRQQLGDIREDLFNSFEGLLTPEQLERLEQYKERRGRDRRPRPGRGNR